ncbi:MAG: IS3 family transposase [Thermoanaerobaculia bacterium]
MHAGDRRGEARRGLQKKARTDVVEQSRQRLRREGVRFAMSDVCKQMGLTPQGHHKAVQAKPARVIAAEMVVQLVAEHRREQPRIGGLKLHDMTKADLVSMGIKLGRDRFFDVLREENLLVEPKRSRTRTTNSFHRFRIWPNLVKGLEVRRADEVWVSDITYIRCRGGFAYLFLVTDVWSRKIVGWSLGPTLETRWSLEALTMAMKGAHAPGEGQRRIHHSDRGVQYCSTEYVKALRSEGIEISMAEAGNPYENAIAERVNGILKDEFLLDRTMENMETARLAVRQAVRAYNTLRPHRSIAMKKPEEKYREAPQTPGPDCGTENEVATTEHEIAATASQAVHKEAA